MSVNADDQTVMSGGNLDDIDSVLDFEDYQRLLDQHQLYKKQHNENIKYTLRDQVTSVQDIVKLIVNQSLTGIEDIELNKKIPYNATNYTLLSCEKVILPFAGLFDDSQNDYLTDGLIEDIEPALNPQDAWIRSKVQVEQKNTELYDAIGKLPGPANKRKSPDTKSMYSVKSKASSKTTKKSKPLMKHNPLPIDLTEPVFVSEEEQKLREHKESERLKREQYKELEYKRRLLEQTEEQLKLQKIKKEKNVIGTTYDYDGELLPVNRMKLQKLPPSSYNMNYEFKDYKETPENIQKKKLTRKGNVPKQKKGKENPLPPISKPQSDQQLPVFDTISLSAGVSLTYDGRRRMGPRPQTLDSQTLSMVTLYPNQTATFSRGKKIRLHKREYEEIINNQDKLGSHKLDGGAQQVSMTVDEQQHHDEEQLMFGKTLDTVQFATRLKNKTLGFTKSKSQSGGIHIKSLKNYENFNNQISEEDELLHQMIQKQEQEKKVKELKILEEKRNQKTPVDKFNYDLTYNKEWGKQHYETGQTLMNYPFGNHKPSEKDQYQSLGKTQKPRSRMGIKTPGDNFDTFQVRQATAEGGIRRPGTTAEGQRSSQGVRIKVTGQQHQQQNNNFIQ